MAITLTPTALAPGIYHASIRVLAGTPQIEDGDQTVAITLSVVDRVHLACLPLVMKP